MLKNIRETLKRLPESLSYRHWLFIAGLTSCLLGIFVYFSLGREEEKAPVLPEERKAMVKVVAAKEDISPRATIRETMLKVIELPEEAVPPGALTDIQEAVNNPAAMIINQGDILTKKKVMSDPKLAGFVGTIPPNCRAVSVAISDVTGVAGFAHAGDFVDVMMVSGRKEDGRLVGQLLLQNVLLLGINKTGEQGTAEKKDNKGTSADGNIKAANEAMATATLAVTPDDALQLATCSQGGTVYLMLRPYKPREQVVIAHDYVMHTNNLRAGGSRPSVNNQRTNNSEAVPQPQYQPSGGGSVEVIRGTTATREGGRR